MATAVATRPPGTCALYNALPTLGQSDLDFKNREAVFDSLKPILAKWNFRWGISLIHAHCKLDEGEVMLSEGNVSRPVLASEAGVYYPDRFLPSGIPYEFTKTPTEEPPKDLIYEFLAVVKATQLEGVLGLYPTDADKDKPAELERTEGRKNITEPITPEGWLAEPVQTAWDFGRGDPVTMACTKWCDTRTSRSGNGDYHKGK